jgi:hypothetical protein
MSNQSSRVRAKAGRPRADDALLIYVNIEAGRRRAGLSVHAYCHKRKVRFLEFRHRDGSLANPRELGGEALRRRYNVAKRSLGLHAPSESMRVANNPLASAPFEVVERMIEEIMASSGKA